jgi:hypothetical protein
VTTGEWDVIERATIFLRELRADLIPATERPAYETALQRWFEKPFAALSRPRERATPAVALARAAHATLAVTVARHPETSAALAPAGRALLEKLAQKPGDLVLDEMAPAAIWAAIASGGRDATTAAITALRTTREAEHRNIVVRSLAAANDVAATGLIRDFVLSGELRVREIFAYLRETFAHPGSREAAWDWVRRDFARLVKVTGEGTKSRFVSLPATLCTSKHEQEIRAFFEPMARNIAGAPRTLANTLETVSRCRAWKQKASAGLAAAILATKE